MTTFYTGRGDDGSTTDFTNPRRESKAGFLYEALGTLDELVSLLGGVRAKLSTGQESADARVRPSPSAAASSLGSDPSPDALLAVQEAIFIIQAEVADSPKRLGEEHVRWLEERIGEIGAVLPEIRTFFIPGEDEGAAMLDLARTVARRAERALVRLHEEGERPLCPPVLAYMNRLSSLLYVMARQRAHAAGKTEQRPSYK